MKYDIQILRRAQKELARLPNIFYERIKDAILALASNPRPQGCKKLSGRDGWRIRVGDYRIIYEVDDNQHVVTILHIGHRRDIYK
jgi:mRNA interferase RelE/StbE